MQADETEWELSGAGDERALQLTLYKDAKADPVPYWPAVVRGHPEIDVSSLRRRGRDAPVGKPSDAFGEDPAAMAKLLSQLKEAGAPVE